ncbi:unnamed protein product [Phaedon cochleariae]|uniref:C2H2-type domain-containing protein n=1 Tax=Phaedon cochleariae TaxID=80249 RepID=A0A9P0GR01_PHACE|nr:unnamed protein product [Phaedon cochleariae]
MVCMLIEQRFKPENIYGTIDFSRDCRVVLSDILLDESFTFENDTAILNQERRNDFACLINFKTAFDLYMHKQTHEDNFRDLLRIKKCIIQETNCNTMLDGTRRRKGRARRRGRTRRKEKSKKKSNNVGRRERERGIEEILPCTGDRRERERGIEEILPKKKSNNVGRRERERGIEEILPCIGDRRERERGIEEILPKKKSNNVGRRERERGIEEILPCIGDRRERERGIEEILPCTGDSDVACSSISSLSSLEFTFNECVEVDSASDFREENLISPTTGLFSAGIASIPTSASSDGPIPDSDSESVVVLDDVKQEDEPQQADPHETAITTTTNFRCNICSFNFHTLAQMIRHMVMKQFCVFHCVACNENMTPLSLLEDICKHKICYNFFECIFCDDSFFEYTSMQVHLVDAHKFSECKTVPENFMRASCANYLSKDSIFTFRCRRCSFTSNNSEELEQHVCTGSVLEVQTFEEHSYAMGMGDALDHWLDERDSRSETKSVTVDDVSGDCDVIEEKFEFTDTMITNNIEIIIDDEICCKTETDEELLPSYQEAVTDLVHDERSEMSTKKIQQQINNKQISANRINELVIDSMNALNHIQSDESVDVDTEQCFITKDDIILPRKKKPRYGMKVYQPIPVQSTVMNNQQLMLLSSSGNDGIHLVDNSEQPMEVQLLNSTVNVPYPPGKSNRKTSRSNPTASTLYSSYPSGLMNRTYKSRQVAMSLTDDSNFLEEIRTGQSFTGNPNVIAPQFLTKSTPYSPAVDLEVSNFCSDMPNNTIRNIASRNIVHVENRMPQLMRFTTVGQNNLQSNPQIVQMIGFRPNGPLVPSNSGLPLAPFTREGNVPRKSRNQSGESMKQLKEDILRNQAQCRVILTSLESTTKKTVAVTVVLEDSDESKDAILNPTDTRQDLEDYKNAGETSLRCEGKTDHVTLVWEDSDESTDTANSQNFNSVEHTLRKGRIFEDDPQSREVSDERDPLDISIVLEDSNDRNFPDIPSTFETDVITLDRRCEICYDVFSDEEELQSHMALHAHNLPGLIINPTVSDTVQTPTNMPASNVQSEASKTSDIQAFFVNDELYYVVPHENNTNIPKHQRNNSNIQQIPPSIPQQPSLPPPYISLATSSHNSNLGIQYPNVNQSRTFIDVPPDPNLSPIIGRTPNVWNESLPVRPSNTHPSNISLTRLNQNIERMIRPPKPVKKPRQPRKPRNKPPELPPEPPTMSNNDAMSSSSYTQPSSFNTLMEPEAISRRTPLMYNDLSFQAYDQNEAPLFAPPNAKAYWDNIHTTLSLPSYNAMDLSKTSNVPERQTMVESMYSLPPPPYQARMIIPEDQNYIHPPPYQPLMVPAEERNAIPPPSYQPRMVTPEERNVKLPTPNPTKRAERRYRNSGLKLSGMPKIIDVQSVQGDYMLASDSITVLSDGEETAVVEQSEKERETVIRFDGDKGKEREGIKSDDENDIEKALPVSFIIK